MNFFWVENRKSETERTREEFHTETHTKAKVYSAE